MTAMTFARGITRVITVATEATFGAQAAGPGQVLRRTTFTMDNQPPEIPSNEITENGLALDATLGVDSVQAALAGQLSPGTYKAFFEALLRGTWTAGVSAYDQGNGSLVINSDGTSTFSSQTLGSEVALNFLTAGFKNGDVVRFSGLTNASATMNGVNFRIALVTANSINFAANTKAVAWSGGENGTLAVAGKKLFTPFQASQVYRSFSIEDWEPETSVSWLGVGIVPTQISLAVQPNGWVTFQMSAAGQTTIDGTAQVYSAPTAQSTSSGVSGVTGKVAYQGNDLAYITGFNLQMAAAAQPVPGIGASVVANIFMGMITGRGSFTCLTTNDTFTADFRAQNDVSLELYLPTSPSASADFISISLPRVRLFSNNKQDSDKALIRSFNFGTLAKVTGGTGTPYDNTAIVIQDSLA